MLVEGLAAAHPQHEPALQLHGAVAAACAMIAGCIRMVGQVTAVLTGSDVASESAPITDHTNGLWPCSSFQGWKWSEIHSASNPASCARLAWSTSSFGPNCSQERKYPIWVMAPRLPARRALKH